MKRIRLIQLFALLTSLGAAKGWAQDRREFLIITIRGQVNVWVLPAEWEAVVKDAHLLLMVGSQTKVSEIAAVRPKMANTPAGSHEVMLSFPASSGKSLTRSFWVPDKYERIEDAPLVEGFYRIDKQTMVRAGAYTVVVE